MAKSQFVMTEAQIRAHAKRAGVELPPELTWKPTDIEKISVPPPLMNKTETNYAMILEAQKQRGEIIDYKYEGMTLRWGRGPKTNKAMFYTPDFVVRAVTGIIQIVEVKGAHIYSRDIVRFKGCAAEWAPFGFDFQMHQKKDGQWKQLH